MFYTLHVVEPLRYDSVDIKTRMNVYVHRCVIIIIIIMCSLIKM